MNLTNEEMDIYFAKLRKNRNQETDKSYKQLMYQPRPEIKIMRELLASLDMENLSSFLKHQDRFLAIKYLLETIVYAAPDDLRKSAYYSDNFIRAFITHIENDFTARIIQIYKSLKLKYVMNWGDQRELLIANFCLNKVHQTCPNFQYFFTEIHSRYPLIINEEVCSWLPRMDNEKISVMGVWEHLDGSSLSQLMPVITREEYLNYFTQIVLALRKAKIMCEFTHYNLISDNVFIINTAKINISHRIGGQEYILSTTKLAKITNFIHSRAIYRSGDNIYTISDSGFSIFPDRSWILQDCFTLLLSSMEIARNYNNLPVLELGEQILKFFTDEGILSILKGQKKNLYKLPYDQGWNINNFVGYLLNNFKLPLIKATRDNIYQERVDIFNALLLGDKIPDDILIFFDLYHLYLTQRKMSTLQQLKEKFDYYPAIGKMITTINSIMDSNKIYISELDVDVDTLEKIYFYLPKLFKLLDSSLYFRFYSNICSKVTEIYNDEITRSQIEETKKDHLSDIKRILNIWDRKIIDNINDKFILDYWNDLINWK